jgi:patatin-like phospholipase/acyl hydrolase
MKKVRILSIDGGGIRGILPGIVLTRIESKLQKKTGNNDIRLADMFDFMAGTSTGGILTLAYLMPGANGHSKFTAQQAVDLYLDRGDEIFDISRWQKIKSLGGLTDERYDATELEEALEDNFGDTRLNELLRPCAIASYDIRNGKPHFFKQHKAKNNEIFNFSVKHVARATSAAPTYFEVARIKNDIGTPFPLIDGGVFANNPALVAYSEARNLTFGTLENPTAKNMMIVSIGTGSVSRKYEYKKAKDWGAVQWIQPIISIMMSGNSQTVDYHLKQIFATLSEKDEKDYYRLEPKIVTADIDMDNASVENMTKLKEDALSYISDSKVDKMLDNVVDKLIGYGGD